LVVRLDTARNKNGSIPAFLPPLWPGTETDLRRSGTYSGGAGATRADASSTRRRRGASRGRDDAAQGDGDDDGFPSKVLALRRLLAGKASPLSSSPSSLVGTRVLVGARVLVLEEHQEVA
jgi:hypothetical protein